MKTGIAKDNTLHLLVREITHRTALAGASMGEKDSLLFARVVQENLDRKLIQFDWAGVTIATGSYLKAAYIPILKKRQSPLIISINLPETVAEDMKIVLENQELSMLIATRVPKRKQYDISVMGSLDDSYKDTLEVVKKKHSVTAGALFDEDKSNIGKTAWMNRLSRLYDMGLLWREKFGKEYQYSFPTPEEL